MPHAAEHAGAPARGTRDAPPAGGALARLRGALAESPPLWWALLYFFSLLCGYYVLRPVRDAMGASGDALTVFPGAWVAFAQAHGWDLADFTLQVLFTCTFLCMLLLQPLYGALVARFPRRVFLPVVYLVFIACLLAFYVAFHRELAGRGVTFFVWTAVFNLFAVTVFWSFMADVFDDAHARQFYGYIGAGGTIGALVGPMITRNLAPRLGVDNLLLVSAGFLCVCLVCILKLRPWAIRREQLRGEASGEGAMGGSMWAGLRLVWKEPLLRTMAVLMFFGVGVGTLLYNEQAAIARQRLHRRRGTHDLLRKHRPGHQRPDHRGPAARHALAAAASRRGSGDADSRVRGAGGLLPARGLAAADARRGGAGVHARGRLLAGQACARNDLHPRRTRMALQGEGRHRYLRVPRRRPELRVAAQGPVALRIAHRVPHGHRRRRRLHPQRMAAHAAAAHTPFRCPDWSVPSMTSRRDFLAVSLSAAGLAAREEHDVRSEERQALVHPREAQVAAAVHEGIDGGLGLVAPFASTRV